MKKLVILGIVIILQFAISYSKEDQTATPELLSQNSFFGVISFTSDRDGDNEIYLIYPNSAEFIKLTDNSWNDVGHGWSPDGTQIAFSSNRDGNYEIYVMDAEGSNLKRLTNRPVSYDFQPRWSPDGSKIVFTSETSNDANL